jgi:hypothetical protein
VTDGPGWFPDPHGRHQHRWWDGTAWTDQVADGGVTSTDPPVAAPGAAPPAPEVAGSKAPVGLLAVLGFVVAAVVVGVVLLLAGGDDGGDEAETATAEEVSDEPEEDEDTSDELTDDVSEDLSEDASDDFTVDFSDDLTDDLSEDLTEEPTSTIPPGDDVSANNLRAGDCVVDEDTLYSNAVTTVPCSRSHVFEVMGKFDVAGLTFPGDARLQETGRQRCTGRLFERYVGLPYAQSVVYASALPPSEETWRVGDRTILCLAHTQDLSPTTGSYRGAGV